MTRKRFVRLIMADGISRNTANKAAEMVQKKKGTYELAYLDHLIVIAKKVMAEIIAELEEVDA